ncbi:MAG: two-component system probable response regulator PhcQ [Gammaproteobacteria bacterium]|jgi:two-component system probable response regulator PhcQ
MAHARIVLVDDEEGVLNALRRLLRRAGYLVDTFSDGPSALAHMQVNPHHAVISDYKMPQMNGVEFLCEVKARFPAVTRMILSGEAERDAVLSSINVAEISRFLTKPWNDAELLKSVATAVEETVRNVEKSVALDEYKTRVDAHYRRSKALEALESESPGITAVNWSDDGTIVLEDS